MVSPTQQGSYSNEPAPIIESNSITNFLKYTLFILVGFIVICISFYLGIQLGKSEPKVAQKANNNVVPTSIPTTEPSRTAEVKIEEPTPIPDIAVSWELFQNADFSFKHPVLDKQCCVVAGPLDIQQATITFADIKSVIPNSDAPFDGFSLYVNDNAGKKAFLDYVEERKKALIENYKFMTDKDLTGQSVEDVVVDGQKGVKLMKYTWWGADLIFIPYPIGSKILIISQTNKSEDSFTPTFSKILSTFKFTR